MNCTIRFPADSEDLLVRTQQAANAAVAEREARQVAGLAASMTAGVLVLQGDEDALSQVLARLERLGVFGAVRVEVAGDDEAAQGVQDRILDRTDSVGVLAVAVPPPPAC
jgi:hypothetical protein